MMPSRARIPAPGNGLLRETARGVSAQLVCRAPGWAPDGLYRMKRNPAGRWRSSPAWKERSFKWEGISSMIADRIREFILSELVQDKSITSLSESESLIESGIIDSLGIQKLLAFLEEKLSIQITDDDIVPENFETIETIVSLIKSKNAAIE